MQKSIAFLFVMCYSNRAQKQKICFVDIIIANSYAISNRFQNSRISYSLLNNYALVAQLDRVSGYEPEGRGFESLPAYQNHIIQIYFTSKTALQ